MIDLRKLVRENRWMSFMVLSVVIFYGALFLAGLFSENEPAHKENAFTAGEMKEKEAAVRDNLAARPALTAWLSFGVLAVIALGVFLDVKIFLKFLGGHPRGAPGAPAAPRWGVRELAQVFVFMLFFEAVVFISQTFWYWSTGLEKIPKDLFLLGNSLARDLGVVGFLWLLLRVRGQSWNELGLKNERILQHVKTGVLGYLAVVPPMLLAFLALAGVMHLFSYEPLPQDVVQIYPKKNTGLYLVFFTLFVAMLGPVLEEIFFRGFAYPALKKRVGPWRAMAFTAAIFAGFHMNAVAFVPIFLLGFFLTYLYETTGSLVPSITAHVLHNTLMVFMTLGYRSLSGSA